MEHIKLVAQCLLYNAPTTCLVRAFWPSSGGGNMEGHCIISVKVVQLVGSEICIHMAVERKMYNIKFELLL
jgi:hypothetical protein